jgi:hypothetical protein
MLFVNAGRMDYARGVIGLFISEAGGVSSVQEAEVCSTTQEPSIGRYIQYVVVTYNR